MREKHSNRKTRGSGNRHGRNRYGQRGVQKVVRGNPRRAYHPDPDATLETVYGDEVPEVFRRAAAKAPSAVCDRCGAPDAVIFKDCPQCGPVPLCSDCTTLHQTEIASEN